MSKFAIIASSSNVQQELRQALAGRGEIDTYNSEVEFLQLGQPQELDCILAEASLAQTLHRHLLDAHAPTPVIHFAAEPSISEAVAAIKMGAVEYLCHHFAAAELHRALEAAQRQKHTGVPERYFGVELPLELKLDSLERELIYDALLRAGGVVGGRNGAAKLLGVTRTGLLYKMKRLHISRSPNEAAEHESGEDVGNEPPREAATGDGL